MIEIIMFLGLIYLFTFFVGRFFEKIKIPAIFSSLVFGILLAIKTPFLNITSSEVFKFLADLGMYFLLFLIGFELNLKEIKESGKFIIKSTFIIIFLEAIVSSLIFHFLFHYSIVISFIIALAFATVGEEILLPILDKFNLIKDKLGKAILEIGIVDDIIEVFAIMLISVYLGVLGTNSSLINVREALFAIFLLFFLTLGFLKIKNKIEASIKNLNLQAIFLFFFGILFVFLAIGKIAEATAIGAILAGIMVRNFIRQREEFKETEYEIKTFAYSFFGPLFFVEVGSSIDIKDFFRFPLLALILVSGIFLAKIIGSYLVGIKKFGAKKSFLLGVGLSVKFSTSILLIQFLKEINILKDPLYSILIGSSVFFVLLPPFIFFLLIKTHEKFKNKFLKSKVHAR